MNLDPINELTWKEYDLLITYITDDQKRFTDHIVDFGYTEKQARAIRDEILATLVAQAAHIL
jgi:hypothetical protein